ncbi:MAG: type II toxin-antitoxin system RelE/ParE family toxin [Paracoccaceae bacterium]
MPPGKTVALAPAARTDLIRLEDFLAAKNPDAAHRMVAALLAAFDRIAASPGAGRPVLSPRTDADLRERLVRFGRSGYVILYAVEPDQILVLRIHHGREDR